MPPDTKEQLVAALITLLVAGAGWLARKVGAWLSASTEKKEEETAHAKALRGLQLLWTLGTSATAQIDATVRPMLFEALKDGTISSTERVEMRKAALEVLKSMAGKEGLESVMAAVGIMSPQVETFLNGLLDQIFAAQSGRALPLGVGVGGITVPTRP